MMTAAPFLATDLNFKAQFKEAIEKHGIQSASYVLIDHGNVVETKEADSLLQACGFGYRGLLALGFASPWLAAS